MRDLWGIRHRLEDSDALDELVRLRICRDYDSRFAVAAENMSFVIRTNPDQTGTIRRTYALLFAYFSALVYFVAVAVLFTAFFSATAPYGTYDHYLRAQARLGSTPSLFWEPLLLPNF